MTNATTFAKLRAAIVNPGERGYWSRTYAVCDEFGLCAIVYAACAQDALDEAADAGKLGAPLDWDDYLEDDDSIALLGNASEPYWIAHTRIEQLNR